MFYLFAFLCTCHAFLPSLDLGQWRRSALFFSRNTRLLTVHDYNWGGVGGQRPKVFTAVMRRCSLCLKAQKRGPII